MEGVIREKRVVIGAEKDVAGFEVAMGQVGGCKFGVEETHSTSDALDYLQTSSPIQLGMTNSTIACS